MDWLNENALRSYPFIDGTDMDAYPAAIVDATFALGFDIPFDFSDETAEIQLRAVNPTGTGAVSLVFQAVSQGVPVGAELIFEVPVGYQRHAVLRAATPGSHGYITLDDITGLPGGSYACAVEAKTLTKVADTRAPEVRAYNTTRRGSYVPYVPRDRDISPEERYNRAKAAAPLWTPNFVLRGPVGSWSGVVQVTPGFHTAIEADGSGGAITILGTRGPSGDPVYDVNTSLPRYVSDKLGTDDPLADIDGDGNVTNNDVRLADDLVDVPPEISVSGVLRGINGRPPTRGDLTLVPGPGTSIITKPETSTIHLELQELRLPTKCM